MEHHHHLCDRVQPAKGIEWELDIPFISNWTFDKEGSPSFPPLLLPLPLPLPLIFGLEEPSWKELQVR